MIRIDGSYGEGGGQVLRSSLGLSLVTGREFEIVNIRAKRKNPGLLRQHLTAVNAAVRVSNGSAEGDRIGSDRLVFRPGKAEAGNYSFAIGTAGSTTLVLQAVLPGLISAKGRSRLTFEGGTHNPFAPPFDFLQRSFLPLLERMGVKSEAFIESYGFYPAGGGKFTITVDPGTSLNAIDITERGEIKKITARSLYSQIPAEIASDELGIIRRRLNVPEISCIAQNVKSPVPGNVVLVEIESSSLCHISTAFGERDLPRKRVADDAVMQARSYIDAGAPVCAYLADQLLIPMVMAGRGSFRTVKPSLHTETNIEVIRQFSDVKIALGQVDERIWEIIIGEKS